MGNASGLVVETAGEAAGQQGIVQTRGDGQAGLQVEAGAQTNGEGHAVGRTAELGEAGLGARCHPGGGCGTEIGIVAPEGALGIEGDAGPGGALDRVLGERIDKRLGLGRAVALRLDFTLLRRGGLRGRLLLHVGRCGSRLVRRDGSFRAFDRLSGSPPRGGAPAYGTLLCGLCRRVPGHGGLRGRDLRQIPGRLAGLCKQCLLLVMMNGWN